MADVAVGMVAKAPVGPAGIVIVYGLFDPAIVIALQDLKISLIFNAKSGPGRLSSFPQLVKRKRARLQTRPISRLFL